MSDISKQYYPISEEDMQVLIKQSKAGDSGSIAELLNMFEPYFNKYISLLYYGKYDLKFYDIRRFIHLFVPSKKVGRLLLRNRLDGKAREEINEVVRGIKYMTNRYCTEEDIRQTTKMTFLMCLDKYEPKLNKDGNLIPFSGFIYSYYFYLLSKQVKVYMIDQHGRKTFPLLLENEMNNDDDSLAPGYKLPTDKSAEDSFADIDIDEHWVIGDTALWPFSSLGVHERQLLKWRYIDKMKYNEIAQKIAEHPNTCREHIAKIRLKVRSMVQEDKEFT